MSRRGIIHCNSHDGPDKWRRLYPTWRKHFPIDHARPTLGTWLDSKWAKGLGVGCKVCRAVGFTTIPFGAYEIRSKDAIQVCNFEKHAQSAAHKAAVAAFLAGNTGLSAMCPTWDAFKHVADDIVAGGALGSAHSQHRKNHVVLEGGLVRL